jgi:hypothetical protein
MIKSIKMLQPVLIEYDQGDSKIFFLDLIDQKLFDFSLNYAPKEETSAVLSDIDKQISDTIVELPDDIHGVLNTEKQLVQDNDNHIFRRN